jgi:dolichyl-phosphate beta-glucosyltransferase
LKTTFLSVIIPAHNEESRLPRSLGQVIAFLGEQSFPAEILVVENGSRDRTLEVAQGFTRQFTRLRVLHEDLPGKGRAVRRGVLEARGEYRFIADTDFSMPPDEISRFIPPACRSDVAIASREVAGAKRYGEPYYRHLTGRVFNLFIRTLVLPGLQDTQCGFKCFHADAAEAIFPLQKMNGWSFDVELLAIARRRGYTITEIGIPWHYNPESKISVLRDSWRMFLDLLTIRGNVRRGIYDA